MNELTVKKALELLGRPAAELPGTFKSNLTEMWKPYSIEEMYIVAEDLKDLGFVDEADRLRLKAALLDWNDKGQPKYAKSPRAEKETQDLSLALSGLVSVLLWTGLPGGELEGPYKSIIDTKIAHIFKVHFITMTPVTHRYWAFENSAEHGWRKVRKQIPRIHPIINLEYDNKIFSLTYNTYTKALAYSVNNSPLRFLNLKVKDYNVHAALGNALRTLIIKK